MNERITRTRNTVRNIRDGALVLAGTAVVCLMEGVIPGTSEQTVDALVYAAAAGGIVAVGAECVLQHAEPVEAS